MNGRGMSRCVKDNTLRSGRSESITDELLDGLGPPHNIYLVSRQLLDDGLDTITPQPDARTHRTYAGV
jgi:hypothetical protein